MSEFDSGDDTDDIADDVKQSSNPQVIDSSIWESLIVGLTALDHHVAETHADSPHDTLAEPRNCVFVIQQRAAALRKKIDEKFVDAIEAHGPLEIGTMRYIVGVDRSSRCLDNQATAECLLDATGGDVNRFCEQLVAQPFKPASVRALIPAEAYARYFEVVIRKSVEGEPVERLVKLDTRFLKPKN